MELHNQIIQRLTSIQREIAELKLQQKEVLTFAEACHLLNFSASHLYKLSCTRQIPSYQPNGKKLYFKRSELEQWLFRSKKYTKDEIQQAASDYIFSSAKKIKR